MGLLVDVDEQNAIASHREPLRQVDIGGGLEAPALVAVDRDDDRVLSLGPPWMFLEYGTHAVDLVDGVTSSPGHSGSPVRLNHIRGR
ncbi:hypothetical protein D3C73_1407940 [compost metagenome]